MIAIAHFVATTCYLGAAALAAAPFARPVRAPVRGVLAALVLGVLVHAMGLAAASGAGSQAPLTGLGPALSFAGLAIAVMLLLAELFAREVSLTVVAAPLAAVPTVAASVIGLHPLVEAPGARGAWLVAHIALSLAGIAAMATSAAAGTVYLVQRHELRSRRFGTLFRFFPPLQTLDRVNHLSIIAGWVGLTVGVAMAIAYSLAYGQREITHVAWGIGAWLGVTALALGRLVGGWQARRAAVAANAAFVAVVVLWLAVRVVASEPGKFL